jgi:uncharacterized protein (TIGR04255 family)
VGIDDLAIPEVTLNRTGLKVVICQLRFDPLLRIAHDPPLQFQEMLRSAYPKLESRLSATQVELSLGEGVELMREPLRQSGGQSKWLFKTDDETWTAALDLNSVSLETTAYEHFPAFAERFRLVFNTFRECYPTITEFRRVGLRYVNVFTRDDFPGGDWRTRFNPNLIGPMADDRLGQDIVAALQVFQIAGADWTIRVRHGTEDDGYRLDMDHATESLVFDHQVVERIERFNKRLYQVFRWAISEEFLNEMEPSERS